MNIETFAIIIAVFVAVALFVWLLVTIRRSEFDFVQWPIERLIRLIVFGMWNLRVMRPFPLPKGQGAILVSNHRSSIDPWLLYPGVGRLVHWMVAKEYVDHPAFGWFLRRAKVIPTRRGGIDTAATREAIRWAQAGGLVGMLPEGRINMTDELLLPVRPGAVLVARKAGVPIVPCYIEGSPYGGTAASPLRMRAHAKVWYGDPIDVGHAEENGDDDDDRGAVMIEVMQAVARLAGQENYPVQLAGRRWKPTESELEKDNTKSAARKKIGR